MTLLAMHIPDGFLAPPVVVVTCLLSIAAMALAFRRLRGELGTRLTPLMGVMSAAIFAGQMVNFPLFGLQASGHLMGGVLAACVLGPWGGMVAMTAVLIVQCLVFGDGGVSALGANVLNMAVIGSGLGYVVYAQLRQWFPGQRGAVWASALASWLIVPVAALALAVEMSAAGSSVPFPRLLQLMLFYHVFIGLGEALLTGLVVSWLVSVRPDVLYAPETEAKPLARAGRLTLAGLTVGCAVAAFLAPWASEFADGLEKVAGRMEFLEQAREVAFAPFPDYGLPSSETDAAPGAEPWWRAAGVVTAGLGILGTLITFVVAAGLSTAVRLSGPSARVSHGA